MAQAIVSINDMKIELKGDADEVNRMLEPLIQHQKNNEYKAPSSRIDDTNRKLELETPPKVRVVKRIRGGPGSLFNILNDMFKEGFFDTYHNLGEATIEVDKRSEQFGTKRYDSSQISTRLIRMCEREPPILIRQKIGEHWSYKKPDNSESKVKEPLQSSLNH
jgi:hypothetical protein